ncbi:MAG TPA: UDP-3-O-acyl-N-acetylglucosamine deacetylase [Armatimonadota bacterium]|jgi:UDP-3-O-[3-hydroxymyristoyl] N-acetylglucosamine deacetylase
MARRRSFQHDFTLAGVGVRSGLPLVVTGRPAPAGSGLRLARTDHGESWPLDLSAAWAAPGCSAVGPGAGGVIYIEHLMAALAARGITDAAFSVDGPEIPLLDGSALPWVLALDEAGVVEVPGEEIAPLLVTAPIVVQSGTAWLTALPAAEASLTFILEHPHPLVGKQWATFRPDQDDFARDLAPARTFTTSEEATWAQDHGLLRGGSEANALVIYPDRYSEEPTLPMACARHKLLDLIGDLYLLGRPVQGQIIGYQSGHRLNHELARRLRAAGEPA